MQKRGYGSEQNVRDLLVQMKAYMSRHVPYHLPASGHLADAETWWQHIPLGHDGQQLMIVRLALLLLHVVPHSAAPERLFSLLKWYQSDRRNRLSSSMLNKMSTIKMCLDQHLPKRAKKQQLSTTTSVAVNTPAAASASSSSSSDVQVLTADDITLEDEWEDDNIDDVLTALQTASTAGLPVGALDDDDHSFCLPSNITEAAQIGLLKQNMSKVWAGIDMNSACLDDTYLQPEPEVPLSAAAASAGDEHVDAGSIFDELFAS